MSLRALHILMPMGGFGIRFKEKGYAIPKPLINVDGKPMFMKAISSLQTIDCDKKYTFIVRFDHNNEFDIVNSIKKYVPNANFIILTENTCGAVETCLKAARSINPHDGLIILDCDLEYFSSTYFNEIKNDLEKPWNDVDIAGRIVSFPSHESRYSYARIDENDFVVETAEKKAISSHAITGSYYFAYAELFFKAARRLIKDFKSGKLSYKEAYLSLIYNDLIESGKKVKLHYLEKYNSFGTPEELNEYYEKQKTLIQGHSGCETVKVTLQNGDFAFKKSTKSSSYAPRLKRQFLKQLAFKERTKFDDYFQTPMIFSMQNAGSEYYAMMEFIDGESFVDVFENDDQGIMRESFTKHVIDFIDKELSEAQMTVIPGQKLRDKFESVKKNIHENEHLKDDIGIMKTLSEYDSLFKVDDSYEMPIGNSHGDFTLSNMIFKNDQCFLVDFLDSFIETPYMDIVKLRQDTKYNWSYLLINKKDIFYKSKQNLILIDEAIVNHYKNDEKFTRAYSILQRLNFLRILQYAKNPIIIDYLKAILVDLLDNELIF